MSCKITNDTFKIIEKIGKGAEGIVYKVRNQDNKLFAIKIGTKVKNPIGKIPENTPHTVLHHSMIQFENTSGLVMEYIQGPTLEKVFFRHVRDRHVIKLDFIIRVAKTLFNFLNFIHELGYVHGDIKDSNIIVSPTEIKLIDFNFFTDVNKEGPYKCRGTRLFMSPQLIEKMRSDDKILTRDDMIKNDIWGAGIILYELCHLKEPYPENLKIEELHDKKYRIRVTKPADNSKMRQLISLCLRKVPSQRLSAARALELLSVIN